MISWSELSALLPEEGENDRAFESIPINTPIPKTYLDVEDSISVQLMTVSRVCNLLWGIFYFSFFDVFREGKHTHLVAMYRLLHATRKRVYRLVRDLKLLESEDPELIDNYDVEEYMDTSGDSPIFNLAFIFDMDTLFTTLDLLYYASFNDPSLPPPSIYFEESDESIVQILEQKVVGFIRGSTDSYHKNRLMQFLYTTLANPGLRRLHYRRTQETEMDEARAQIVVLARFPMVSEFFAKSTFASLLDSPVHRSFTLSFAYISYMESQARDMTSGVRNWYSIGYSEDITNITQTPTVAYNPLTNCWVFFQSKQCKPQPFKDAIRAFRLYEKYVDAERRQQTPSASGVFGTSQIEQEDSG